MEDPEAPTAGRGDAAPFMTGPRVDPLRGKMPNLACGVVLTLLFWVIHSVLGLVHWHSFAGYLIVAIMISFTGWAADRVWYATVEGMLKKPMAFIGYVTRVPFWYIAGGIGYVLGMLTAKRCGFMGFYDIPVEPLFALGGKLSCLLQIPLQVLGYRVMMRASSPIR